MSDIQVKTAPERSLTVLAWDHAYTGPALAIGAARWATGASVAQRLMPLGTAAALEATDINWDTPSAKTVGKAAAVGAAIETLAGGVSATSVAKGAAIGAASYGLTLGLRELLFRHAFSATSRRRRHRNR